MDEELRGEENEGKNVTKRTVRVEGFENGRVPYGFLEVFLMVNFFFMVFFFSSDY